MKNIVIYYSNTGNNDYLANRIAKQLNCPIEKIQPNVDVQVLLMFGVNFGIKKIKSNLKEYDRVILVGPIWMGKFVAPLKSFLKSYKKDIKKLVFATCCGSTFEKSRDKFGHELVFEKVEAEYGSAILSQAFPIVLALPEDKREDDKAVMATRLSDENFIGELEPIFNDFMKKIKSN